MKRFQGKTAIVTGAGSGIGAATAKRLAAEGTNVVLVGRTREKLERTSADLDPARTSVQVADVGDHTAATGLASATLERFGTLDVLVNNAGVASVGCFHESSIEDYKRLMATNIDGVVYCSQTCMPHLLRSRGSIVNVSSVGGLGADPGLSFYDASKGAVTNLTRALALEYGGRGVRINAVNPDLTVSDITGPNSRIAPSSKCSSPAYPSAVRRMPRRWPRSSRSWRARPQAMSMASTFQSMAGCPHRPVRHG